MSKIITIKIQKCINIKIIDNFDNSHKTSQNFVSIYHNFDNNNNLYIRFSLVKIIHRLNNSIYFLVKKIMHTRK